MMTPENAAATPHANVLTRAVGVQPTVAVDLLPLDVLPGDTFLLCSDGLYEYAREEAALAGALSAADVAAIPQRLVKQALEGGGHDNATALIVRAVSEAAHHQARKDSVRRELEALSELELLRELDRPELVKVHNLFATESVARGVQIIREGDAGEHLFVIVEGSFEIARQGVELGTLERGAHFGEMALLNRRPRTATVTARESSRLLTLDRERFQFLLHTEPQIAAKILRRFAETLSLRLDDTYLARDFRGGRKTLGLGEYP
jgi:CRP-like cAMP-binding protein